MENASKEYTYSKVKELIIHQQEKYNWEYIFLGANIDIAKEAWNIGISQDNAFSYEATKDDIEMMYCQACEAVAEKRKDKYE